MNTWRILHGDVRERLADLPDGSVQCCVTSPPYWGLRDYGTARWEGGDPGCNHRPPDEAGHTNKPSAGQREHAGRFAGAACWKCGARRIDSQIGLEPTPDAYVQSMVQVFREVRRVLADDGTCWLNLGDSYAGGNTSGQWREGSARADGCVRGDGETSRRNRNGLGAVSGVKPKDLIGIPWRVAFALQADGWYLRSDIIWAKPNPMPESVTDRPTKAHEYIFLLTKRERYYYDAAAIAEVSTYPGDDRARRGDTRKAIVPMCMDGGSRARTGLPTGEKRNRRTVWEVTTQPFNGALLIADYVGADGKPYKVSPDCPVHGPRRGNKTTQTPERDAQLDRLSSDTPDTASDRGLGLDGVCASTLPLGVSIETGSDYEGASIPASTNGSRTSGLGAAGIQRHHHTVDTGEIAADSSDLPRLACAETATPHNSESHRTGRAHATTAPCIASAQISDGIGDTSTSREIGGPSSRTHESSISADCGACAPGIVTSKTRSRSAGSSSCNCIIVSVDHFATFPEKLVELCILAGSRMGDTVLDPFCGSGTTGAVAIGLGRNFIGVELNAAYIELARKRIGSVAPMFAQELSA